MGDTPTGSPQDSGSAAIAGGAHRAGGSRGRGALKAVFFGLLPLALLLLLAEVLLWALELGDPAQRLSLARGFDERARYLVADPDVPGGWVTQMFDGADPEIRIPPRSDRVRVLMFGGSNTQGFPKRYLETVLDAQAPDPGFEVVNLGRQGYGSERVRILLEQAMVLQPDIVFIYSGHNEFVERGFALELTQSWREPWIVRLVDRLTRLRTLNVLVSALERRPDPAATSGPLPEKRVERGPDFRGLSYKETLQFYDEYRRNLERMIATARGHGAQVMISTVVGNMLVPPVVVTDPPGLSEAKVARLRMLQANAMKLIPEHLRAGLIQTGKTSAPIRLDPRKWGETIRVDERERRLAEPPPEFDPPALRPIAPPFDGGPFWENQELWTDEVRALLSTVASVLARDLTPAQRLDVAAAEAKLREALGVSPQDAVTLYGLGLCTWLLGNDDGAACQLLRDSARYDHAPIRGNDVTNTIVRELAAAQPGVLLVDAERAVVAACPGGLVTYELLMDNCHFYPAVRPQLMDLFVPGLVELSRR